MFGRLTGYSVVLVCYFGPIGLRQMERCGRLSGDRLTSIHCIQIQWIHFRGGTRECTHANPFNLPHSPL